MECRSRRKGVSGTIIVSAKSMLEGEHGAGYVGALREELGILSEKLEVLSEAINVSNMYERSCEVELF